jgi:hypothetical protein
VDRVRLEPVDQLVSLEVLARWVQPDHLDSLDQLEQREELDRLDQLEFQV